MEFSPAFWEGLLKIIGINIVLSGDNAVVIALASRSLPPHLRGKAIWLGAAGAVGLRLVFSFFIVELMAIPYLKIIGALLLLWIAWRLYRDIREQHAEKTGLATMEADRKSGNGKAPALSSVPLGRAIWQIAVADISMSVDNVLAIAGAANQNVPVLVIGLVVSIALMGVAATYIARLLQRYPALSYVGVALIVYVGGEMIWEGSGDVPEILRFFH